MIRLTEDCPNLQSMIAIDYLETKENLAEWVSRTEQYYADVEKFMWKISNKEIQVEVALSYVVIDGYTRFLQVADIGFWTDFKTDEKLCSLRI